jgi:hygromycin-B 4-O-kinase
MKTQFNMQKVTQFLEDVEQAEPQTIHPLIEGHISQAFSFEAAQNKYVLRLSETDADFKADQFAFDHFGQGLPVPKVSEIGKFSSSAYYCVTNFVDGKGSNTLSSDEVARTLPSIWQALGSTFTTDISFSQGYGDLDIMSGNGSSDSWHEHILKLEREGVDSFKRNATSVGLNPELIDKFFEQYRANLPFASETRRLLHGDPAFDNMLIDEDKVVAVIDWAQLGYGDWMSDFARLDFWWPGRYGDKEEFAKSFGLEDDHINERQALYWATNALWTIEFADKAKSESVTQWLHEHIESKLIS